VDRDLVVSSYQVNLRKGGAAGNSMVVFLYVWDWIPLRDDQCVKGSIFSTEPATAVLIRNEIEGERPRTLGASSVAVPQHGVELDLGEGQAVWCQAA